MKNREKKLVFKIIEETLGLSKGNLKISSNSDNINSWDSLGVINIIVALENAFKIKFQIKDYEKFNSMKEIVKLLSNKLS